MRGLLLISSVSAGEVLPSTAEKRDLRLLARTHITNRNTFPPPGVSMLGLSDGSGSVVACQDMR